ncbi:MAG: dihydroorotase [Planctomycetota bacterium]
MPSILLRHVRAIDPAEPSDMVLDAGIADGKIRRKGLRDVRWDETVDCDGRLILSPGFVDAHVHLREPGSEASETIETGTRAAAAGGFAAIAAMPNTDPPPDSPERVRALFERIRARAAVRVFVVGTLTEGRKGERPASIEAMAEAGAIAFSDDGAWIADTGVMQACLRACKAAGRPAITHAEDPSVSGAGVLNEGEIARALGVSGIPPAAEEIATFRDVCLAAATGARLHVAHVSTALAAGIVREAKARGAPVTAETAPHYISLTEEDARSCGANAKMKPPLRTAADREALRAALADGTIDAVATDHAPHAGKDAASPLAAAPFGVVGLETALGVLATHLLAARPREPGKLSWLSLLACLTTGPARVLGIPRPSLSDGAPADAVLFDPDARATVDPARFFSKGRNTPFAGVSLRTRVIRTWVEGRGVYRAP